MSSSSSRSQTIKKSNETDSQASSVPASDVSSIHSGVDDDAEIERKIDSLTVERLKAALKSKGLPMNGKKVELQARLRSFYKEAGPENVEPVSSNVPKQTVSSSSSSSTTSALESKTLQAPPPPALVPPTIQPTTIAAPPVAIIAPKTCEMRKIKIRFDKNVDIIRFDSLSPKVLDEVYETIRSLYSPPATLYDKTKEKDAQEIYLTTSSNESSSFEVYVLTKAFLKSCPLLEEPDGPEFVARSDTKGDVANPIPEIISYPKSMTPNAWLAYFGFTIFVTLVELTFSRIFFSTTTSSFVTGLAGPILLSKFLWGTLPSSAKNFWVYSMVIVVGAWSWIAISSLTSRVNKIFALGKKYFPRLVAFSLDVSSASKSAQSGVSGIFKKVQSVIFKVIAYPFRDVRFYWAFQWFTLWSRILGDKVMAATPYISVISFFSLFLPQSVVVGFVLASLFVVETAPDVAKFMDPQSNSNPINFGLPFGSPFTVPNGLLQETVPGAVSNFVVSMQGTSYVKLSWKYASPSIFRGSVFIPIVKSLIQIRYPGSEDWTTLQETSTPTPKPKSLAMFEYATLALGCYLLSQTLDPLFSGPLITLLLMIQYYQYGTSTWISLNQESGSYLAQGLNHSVTYEFRVVSIDQLDRKAISAIIPVKLQPSLDERRLLVVHENADESTIKLRIASVRWNGNMENEDDLKVWKRTIRAALASDVRKGQNPPDVVFSTSKKDHEVVGLSYLKGDELSKSGTKNISWASVPIVIMHQPGTHTTWDTNYALPEKLIPLPWDLNLSIAFFLLATFGGFVVAYFGLLTKQDVSNTFEAVAREQALIVSCVVSAILWGNLSLFFLEYLASLGTHGWIKKMVNPKFQSFIKSNENLAYIGSSLGLKLLHIVILTISFTLVYFSIASVWFLIWTVLNSSIIFSLIDPVPPPLKSPVLINQSALIGVVMIILALLYAYIPVGLFAIMVGGFAYYFDVNLSSIVKGKEMRFKVPFTLIKDLFTILKDQNVNAKVIAMKNLIAETLGFGEEVAEQEEPPTMTPPTTVSPSPNQTRQTQVEEVSNELNSSIVASSPSPQTPSVVSRTRTPVAGGLVISSSQQPRAPNTPGTFLDALNDSNN